MSQTLIAYFSATGRTASIADALSSTMEADVFEINPAVAYTNEDLNWNNDQSRSSLEMKDPSSRPEISNHVEDMSKYDTVFIGFPIWWYREPSIIDTFIDSYDFTNKKVLLFCTSGGSGIESAVSNVKKMIPEALSVEGKRLSNIKEAKQWIKKER